MTGKQLRNSILQWAIQGKLVPQDPNDEPASVLLERIRAEKARLVKEKKIKKDKNETTIYRGEDNSYYEKTIATGAVRCIDDEIPFNLPTGWEWTRLKTICTMQAGKNISASEIYREQNETHPYRCVGGNGLRGFVARYNTSGHNAIVGRQGALCGCLNIEQGNYYATEHAVVVDTYEILPPEFMYYFLIALNLNQYATATAQPGLAVSNIIEVLFPLPPCQEQIRIVDTLSQLDPIIKQFDLAEGELTKLTETIKVKLRLAILQEAIQGRLVTQIEAEGTADELLDEIRAEKQRLVKEGKLKKSAIANESRIFRGDDNKYYEQIGSETTLIDREYDFPKSWSIVRLSSVCSLLDGEKKDGQYVYMDAKYLRGKSSGEYINEGRFIAEGQSIILVDGENSGEVFIVPHDGYMGSTFKQLWISEMLYKPYILSVIRFYKDLFRQSKRGAAIPHLNKEVFNNLLIGLPPLKEQIRIVKQIERLTEAIK